MEQCAGMCDKQPLEICFLRLFTASNVSFAIKEAPSTAYSILRHLSKILSSLHNIVLGSVVGFERVSLLSPAAQNSFCKSSDDEMDGFFLM